MHDEHALLADLRQPLGEHRAISRRRLVGHVAAGVVEQPGADQLGDAVDQAGAAHADRLDVADHVERERVVGDLDALDRALGGAHAAADLGGLERRAGRRGGGDARALARPARSREFVPTSMNRRSALVARQAGGEHAGDDVAAHVGAERREDHRRRARVDGDAEVGGQRRRQLVRGDDERRHRQRLGVDAERDLGHRHVADER